MTISRRNDWLGLIAFGLIYQIIFEQAKLIDERYSKFIAKSKGNRKKEEIELFSSLNELQKMYQDKPLSTEQQPSLTSET